MATSLPTTVRPVEQAKIPDLPLPLGATDCHAHLFGPQSRYPMLPKTHFVPHEHSLEDYAHMLRRLGCDRAVLVQPSVYGTDNRLIEEALRSPPAGIALRGVAVVDGGVTDAELERLHALGFRGIRINTASATQGLALERAVSLAARIRELGWHLQFFVDLGAQPDIAELLAKLPCKVVIDHFGKVQAADGVSSPAFQALLGLLRHEHCHAKLIGPYFVSRRMPDYPDMQPLVRAMADVAADRLVWGTDWPHPSAYEQMPDDGVLADVLLSWVGGQDLRDRILVENPARLYGF